MYSSDVKLSMTADGKQIRLSHVAPKFIVLGEHLHIQQPDAVVTVTVDGRAHSRDVRLTCGEYKSGDRVELM